MSTAFALGGYKTLLVDLDPQGSVHHSLGIEPGIGVVISNVKSGSPAEKSGLLPGMIVLEAERQAVKNIDTFKEIINDIDQGKGILLLIRTSNGSSYLFLKEN